MSDGRKKIAEQASAAERHGRDLHKVNEKLRELVSSLKAEQSRLADARPPAAAPPPAAPAAPAWSAPAADAAVDLEKKRLGAELALAREALEHAQAERDRLRERLGEIETENQRLCDEYVAVEQRSSELAQLYVALERLHGGLSREETLTALQEIVINVIGTEELAVLELRGDRLELVHAFGVDPAPLRSVPAGEGAIGRAARSGQLFVAGRGEKPGVREADLTAAIPLRVGDRVHGVLAIFRLLGHKPNLAEADQAVFDLLAAHAGLALHLRGAAPAARA